MIFSEFDQIKVTGVTAALPTRKVVNTDFRERFGDVTVDRLIDSTGVRERYVVAENQTAGDLACAAARRLLAEKQVDPASIGLLVFVVTYPDYFSPATANVIQARLGLSTRCLVFDMNMACSGFVAGLQTVAALLAAGNAERALLLVGDTTSRVISPEDKSLLLFGDGGGAALVERVPNAPPLRFAFRNDGSRFRAIAVPAGGFRRPSAPRELADEADGNRRSLYHLHMNGTDVFAFTLSDVPKLILEFLARTGRSATDFDAGIFHQPNAFILRHLAKKIKLPPDRMPLSLDRFGNTSGVSIPLTLCDCLGGVTGGGDRRLLLSGFGVGLSWSAAEAAIDADDVFPVAFTDETFDDGWAN